MNIADLQVLCLKHHIPFFSYRDPVECSLRIGIQTSSPHVAEISDLTHEILLHAKGFLFSPFDTNVHKRFFIKADFIFGDKVPETISKIIQKNDYPEAKSNTYEDINNLSKIEYQSIVNGIIKRIENGEAEKVVCSRAISANINTSAEEASRLFKNICLQNKNAFAYWIYIPGMPMWLGASPELFLRKNKQTLQTVALAGTKKTKDEWDEKNQVEHIIVADYIEKIFKREGIKDFVREEPTTIKSGTMYHLQTKFRATLENNSVLSSLIRDMHPTPAVCGYPKEAAKKIIEESEKYDRQYYAGYLGMLYGNGDFSLYVNLRCLSLTKNIIKIYAGGGLTKDSKPEDEWKETILKTQTMRHLLSYNLKIYNTRH